jgi:cytochrome c peroxidase
MGAYVGGSMYQKMGAVKAWTNTSDPGRFRITGREEDRMLFKVPSLRNVEKTAPYYHNGSVPTLEQAVKAMGEFQLGRGLSNDQVQLVTAWLKTLTGAIPADFIKPPLLPESTARTPKPEPN